MSNAESGRAYPEGITEDEICFSSREIPPGSHVENFFTFSAPQEPYRECFDPKLMLGNNDNHWVREPGHIIACDNKQGQYIRLNRQDALDLAKWLVNVAREMDD